MKIVADTHTHTIASTHAYSTLQEMVRAAAEQNLYAIAVTDHCDAMPGSPGPWYFECFHNIPSTLYGVRVLMGAEANIMDYKGKLDLSPHLQKKLEWVVASIHGATLKEKPSVEKCTQAYLAAAENPYINVIGHSGTPEFAYDYEKVIPAFAKNGKLVEINNGTFSFRPKSVRNCLTIAKLCKKHRARIVVNTDSHFSVAVGKVDQAMELLREIDFPKELIVNASIDTFKDYLKENDIPLA